MSHSEMSCHRDYLILDFKQKSEALGCAREHTVLILKLTGGMKHQSLLSTEAEGLLTTPAGWRVLGVLQGSCPSPIASHHTLLGGLVPRWAQGKRTPGFPSGALVHHPDTGLRFHLSVTGKEQVYFLNIEI